MPHPRPRLAAAAPLLLAALVAALAGQQAPRAAASDVVLFASDATITGSAWSIVGDASAASGARIASPNRKAASSAAPRAAPASFFELTFEAEAGIPYHLWLRMKAAGDSWANDSVFVQFSGSVTSSGAPAWRIGTTSALTVNLEDCAGCGLSGWGWQDNGYGAGVLGAHVYFAASGTQRLRVQVREDGVSIDQVVLSGATWLTSPPGATRNDDTILIGGESEPPPTVTLTRQPYLHQVTDRSAVIVWASREPGPAHAVVGGRSVAATSTLYPASRTGLSNDYYQHEAHVTGLSPATTYAYDVYVGRARATSGTDRFTTAPAAGSGTVTFIAFGDSGTGSTAQRALAERMAADTFDLILHVGDIVYGNSGGTGDATHKAYQSWFFDVYRDLLRRRPFFPTPGNHDERAGTRWGRPYRDVYALSEAAGEGAYADHAERYYSFDYGPVHFVALDTELPFTDAGRLAAERDWLEQDLAATRQPWKIAYYHRAAYSSGEHGSSLDVRDAFEDLFERYGVQVALAGHDHGYQRMVPWRESTGASAHAVVNVVTAGGGAPLYAVGRSAWTAVALSRHHYVRGEISGCTARFRAIDPNGAVIDSYTLDRCLQAKDAARALVRFASPAAGASVSGTLTVRADADDDTRIEKVDLWIDGRLRGIDVAAPYEFAWNTAAEAAGSHTLQLRAVDLAGRRTSSTITVTVRTGTSAGAGDVVIYARDVADSSIAGDWTKVEDPTAAGSVRLWNPDRGAPKRTTAAAAPGSYFDVTFDAAGDTPYHLWLRMRAEDDYWGNDSVYAQFSGAVDASGAPIYRIGTSSGAPVVLEEGVGAGIHGWGWNDTDWGGLADPIAFAATGPQTLRIQVREDGVSIDQIVLSPSTYLAASPGTLRDDETSVAR